MKQHQTRNVRHWWALAVLAGLLIGLPLGLMGPAPGFAGIGEQPGGLTETAFSAQLEPLTRQHLEEISQRLVVVEDTLEFVGQADQNDGSFFKKYLLESLQKFFGKGDGDLRQIVRTMRTIQEENA